jgi:hypothetical protein
MTTDWAPVVALLRGYPVPVPAPKGTVFSTGIFAGQFDVRSIMECPYRGCEEAIGIPAVRFPLARAVDWDTAIRQRIHKHMRSHEPAWRRVLRDVWEGLVAAWRLLWWR